MRFLVEKLNPNTDLSQPEITQKKLGSAFKVKDINRKAISKKA
jgi:hypothetical protein